MIPELKSGDYVQLDRNGRVVKCDPTDFAYGTVVQVHPNGQVMITRLGTGSRFPHVVERHTLREDIPDLANPEAVEQWLRT